MFIAIIPDVKLWIMFISANEIIDFGNPSMFGIFHHFEHASGVGKCGVLENIYYSKRRIEWKIMKS